MRRKNQALEMVISRVAPFVPLFKLCEFILGLLRHEHALGYCFSGFVGDLEAALWLKPLNSLKNHTSQMELGAGRTYGLRI